MRIVDVNVLLCAVNSADRNHGAAAEWLGDALRGKQTVGFAWMTLLGFLRIATNPSVFEHPHQPDQAFEIIDAWLSSPRSVTVEPTSRHLMIMNGLLGQAGTAGNLTTDAHLAALAIEYGGRIVSFDRDFERFGVEVVIPGRFRD